MEIIFLLTYDVNSLVILIKINQNDPGSIKVSYMVSIFNKMLYHLRNSLPTYMWPQLQRWLVIVYNFTKSSSRNQCAWQGNNLLSKCEDLTLGDHFVV